MKKNFGKLMFVSIILSLAVFSATFGVYAIINAQLNMSLSVGYLSHNCSANVSGVITGASIDGEAAPADIPLTNVTINGKNKQIQSINFGTFYFTTVGTQNALGKPHPIKVWLTIENTSEFQIAIDVSLPTITDVEVVVDKSHHVIPEGKTDVIMITFSLININTTSLNNALASKELTLSFRKFLRTKQDVVVYKDATVTHFVNHPYFIIFGKYFSETDIYWIVGGTIDSNGQTVALTADDRAQLDTGKFAADKNYYLICARSLYGNKNYLKLTMQNNSYWGESSYSQGDAYLIEYPQIDNVLDYSLSTIRQYLVGHTVYGHIKNDTNKTITPDTSLVSTNFIELYDFDWEIYSLIQKRSLSSIYQTLNLNNTPLDFPTGKVDNLTANEADAFWIPTEADISVLGEDWVSYHADGDAERYYTFTRQSASHYKKHTMYLGAEKKVDYYIYNALESKFRVAFII